MQVPQHKIVNFNRENITNVTSQEIPGHFFGQDHSWNVDKFQKNLQVQFHSNRKYDSTFSVVGIEAAIANAFRRIMVAEIPSLAIENVYVYNNSSIIHDEVLSHRLGLIPLRGNPEGLRWLRWFRKPDGSSDPGTEASDFNTVVLELTAECSWRENGKVLASKGVTDPKRLYNNSSVYAHQIDFRPHGQQVEYFGQEAGPIVPSNPDILILKLRPGQKVKLTMHCVKGIGADHAKFSPVATASYRLMPHIRILKPITGKDARMFRRCFPKGVIRLDRVTPEQAEANLELKGQEGREIAVVADPMKDTMSRECLRHERFQGKVKLGRIQDHFIYHVESTGAYDSDEVFLESVRLLKAKCLRLKKQLTEGDL